MVEYWNSGRLGWERNLDQPGKAIFLKPMIPSFRSKVERPRVQRVKAHYSTLKTSPSRHHPLVFRDRKPGNKVLSIATGLNKIEYKLTYQKFTPLKNGLCF